MHFTWDISIETLVALVVLMAATIRSFSRGDIQGEQTKERVKENERAIQSNRDVTAALNTEIARMREWMKAHDRRADQRDEKIDRLTESLSHIGGAIEQITERLRAIQEKLDERRFNR